MTSILNIYSYIKEAISAIFYNQGILDLKQARTLAGKSRREFEEDTLPKFGFTIMDGVDIDLEINEILNDNKSIVSD